MTSKQAHGVPYMDPVSQIASATGDYAAAGVSPVEAVRGEPDGFWGEWIVLGFLAALVLTAVFS